MRERSSHTGRFDTAEVLGVGVDLLDGTNKLEDTSNLVRKEGKPTVNRHNLSSPLEHNIEVKSAYDSRAKELKNTEGQGNGHKEEESRPNVVQEVELHDGSDRDAANDDIQANGETGDRRCEKESLSLIRLSPGRGLRRVPKLIGVNLSPDKVDHVLVHDFGCGDELGHLNRSEWMQERGRSISTQCSGLSRRQPDQPGQDKKSTVLSPHQTTRPTIGWIGQRRPVGVVWPGKALRSRPGLEPSSRRSGGRTSHYQD